MSDAYSAYLLIATDMLPRIAVMLTVLALVGLMHRAFRGEGHV